MFQAWSFMFQVNRVCVIFTNRRTPALFTLEERRVDRYDEMMEQ